MAVNTVLATNLLALNTNRNMKTAGKSKTRHSNRLASGSKISTASEDAAGLTISEKMKSQIRGLDMAEKNTEDAISLLSTAEGAYSEISEMLQRSREVTLQALNDTNSQEDKMKLMSEVDGLLTDIEQTLDKTEYNGKSIVEFNNVNIQLGANSAQSLELTEIKDIDLNFYDKGTHEKLLREIDEVLYPMLDKIKNININPAQQDGCGTALNFNGGTVVLGNVGMHINTIKKVFSGIDTDLLPDLKASIEKFEKSINTATSQAQNSAKIDWEFKGIDPNTQSTVNNSKGEEALFPGNATVTGAMVDEIFKKPGDNVIIRNSDLPLLAKALETAMNKFADEIRGLRKENFEFNVQAALKEDLRKEKITNKRLEIYLGAYDGALEEVAEIRAGIGAKQNGLEYTIGGLQTSSENLTLANSQIEDADMAGEMMGLTKTNVLINASMTILSQSNSSKEDVLQLLK